MLSAQQALWVGTHLVMGRPRQGHLVLSLGPLPQALTSWLDSNKLLFPGQLGL